MVAALTGGVGAVLFVAGLWVAGTIAGKVWGDRREQQAALHQARTRCAAGRYDPTEWGTPTQQVDSCIADAMDTYIGFGVHPYVIVAAAVAAWYLGFTGLTTWLAWDYWADRRRWRDDPRASAWVAPAWTTAVSEGRGQESASWRGQSWRRYWWGHSRSPRTSGA
jgi:hypothetical protein